MKSLLVRILAVSFYVIPFILQSGDGSDSKIVFPGSAAGGRDLVLAIGGANREAKIERDGTLAHADDLLDGLKGAGSSLIAQSHGQTTSMPSATFTVPPNSPCFVMVNIPINTPVTGAMFVQTTTGVYTASPENRIGLYSFDGTQLTLIASSADNGNLWKGAANSLVLVPFSAPVNVVAGTYWIGFTYNRTSPITSPQIAAAPNVISGAFSTIDLPNSGAIATYGASAPGATLPTTVTGMSANTPRYWFGLY